MHHLFYTPDINSAIYTLNEEESKHCIRVLRLKTGDTIFLIDGKGGYYKVEILIDDPKKCVVKVLDKQTEYGKRNFYLHIAIAPTKNMDRMEWFLEKATEIGIDEITPIICERSERKEIKTERLEKIITSAVKQSVKGYYPKLNNATSFKDFIKIEFVGQRLLAHCIEGEKNHLKNIYRPKENALILIGPEGDFSSNEAENALSKGFQGISLGTSRLRTETAGIVVCAAVNLLNE